MSAGSTAAMTGPRAVLFDLDGTLVDSAPDLAGAINDLRIERGLPAMPYEVLRPMAGAGARGMVGAGFGLAPGDDGFDTLRDAFLARYAQRLLQDSTLFDGITALLEALREQGWRWGVVTNKAMRFAQPVLEGLGLRAHASVVIAGDSTPHPKPHPAPLLTAAQHLALDADRCIYVGDDLRDVQAGRAAGMPTLAAAWGYLGRGEHIAAWGADAVVAHPGEVLAWLARQR